MFTFQFLNDKMNTLPSKNMQTEQNSLTKLIYFSLYLREREEKKIKDFAPLKPLKSQMRGLKEYHGTIQFLPIMQELQIFSPNLNCE